MTLKCRNIKFSVELEHTLELSTLKCKVFEKQICFILKNTFAVFTIYKNNHKKIHITGVKSSDDVFETFYFIEKTLENSIISLKIDNSMFSCKQKIELDRIIFRNSLLMFNHLYKSQFKYEIFPGTFIKPQPHLKKIGHPTILFFETGSYVLIGGKNICEINKARVFIVNLINKCKK